MLGENSDDQTMFLYFSLLKRNKSSTFSLNGVREFWWQQNGEEGAGEIFTKLSGVLQI